MTFDPDRYKIFRQRLSEAELERKTISKCIRERTAYIKEMENQYACAWEAKEVFKSISISLMIHLQDRISNLVSLGLKTVFPDPPKFVVNMVIRRDKLECDLLFQRGEEVYSPSEAEGGGLLDVTSFCLRLAYWSLNPTSPVFILDEPFKFVSPDLHYRVEQMLKLFCSKLGVQIIMVSHSDYLLPRTDKDRIFVVRSVNGKSKVEGEN